MLLPITGWIARRSSRDPVAKQACVLACGWLIALATAAVGCFQPEGRFDRIVLVSIDTLRSDHLGAYGYPRPVSGFIDELARDGVLFERAYASMSTTSPSHATMFTGLHPIQHGVRRNGDQLSDEATTLAELLSARGFSTAGFSGSRAHFLAGNLDQGFGYFEEPPNTPGAMYQPADQTLQAARTWLRSQPKARPLFLVLHLFDVHHPWNAPEFHRREVVRESAEADFDPDYWISNQHIPLDFYSRRVDQMRATIDAYDAEIRFVDSELRHFASDFAAWAGGGTTLWIVTADHGEGLGNHDWLFHGKHIYDEQVRVPLIFYASDNRFANRRVEEIVQHTDLLATVLDLAAAPSAGDDAESAHRASSPGRSLVALLQGASPSGERRASAFIQRRSFDPNPEADARASLGEVRADNRYESGDTYAWVEAGWKLIHRTIGSDELFDLEADPYETRNLAGEQRERVAQMRAVLDERIRELAENALGVAPRVGPEAQERLEALGYLP
jgi:arylsulfatase A-like enzyme